MKQNSKLSDQPVIYQLFSLIPEEIIHQAAKEYKSDYYYKTLTTKKQLAFLLYGVITRCHSLNSLCKSLLFLANKLMYIGVNKLPARPFVPRLYNSGLILHSTFNDQLLIFIILLKTKKVRMDARTSFFVF